MIIFIQSYASPKSIEQSDVYKYINEYYSGKVVPIKIYDKKTRNLSIKESIKVAINSWKLAKNDDILFGWGTDICLFAMLRNILGFKRKNLIYLSQNLIFNPLGKGIKHKIRGILYKYALKLDNFYVTVNSPALVDYYASFFRCKKNKFFLVYDSMSLSETEESLKQNRTTNKPYVFFGGKSYRDINTFLRIVKLLPTVSFKAVLLENMITPEMMQLNNLEIFHNVEYDKFYEILNNAEVCCIPLNALIPCGLFVMQHAILLDIPIVSTETLSMRTIVPNDEYGFLLKMGDAEGMAQKIQLLLNNKELKEKITLNAKKNMDLMKPKAVAQQICNAINQICHNRFESRI